MKTKKIISYIMSVALTFSSLCCLSNTDQNSNNTASAISGCLSESVAECTGMECSIENPDFVISENEMLNSTDLQRHGIKITRNIKINDPAQAERCGININAGENTPLYACKLIFPDKLAQGKNLIHINSYSPFSSSEHLECDLEINVTFSESSEKKDLHKRCDTLFGDVDGSGVVDSKDLLELSLYMLDHTKLTAGQYMSADVSGDDQVDISDLALLRQYIMKDDVDLGRTKKPDEDIAFIKINTNFASGFQCHGVIYDKKGNEYYFDFSDNYPESIEDYVPLDRIKNAYRNNEILRKNSFTDENMTYMSSLINKIDPKAEFIEEPYAADYGIETLYGLKYNEDGTEELVKLFSFGDFIQTPTDKNADELYKYFFSTLNPDDIRAHIDEINY